MIRSHARRTARNAAVFVFAGAATVAASMVFVRFAPAQSLVPQVATPSATANVASPSTAAPSPAPSVSTVVDPSAAARLRLVKPQGTAGSGDVRTSFPTLPAADREPPPADPTLPGPEMRDLLNQNRTQPSAAAPRPEASALPEIKLKARVMAAGKPAVAVVEIGGKLLTVREGAAITLGDPNDPSRSLQLTVVELSNTSVRLEAVNRKLTLTLN